MPIVEVTPGVFEYEIELDLDAGVFLSALVEPTLGRVRLEAQAPLSPSGATIVITRRHPSGRVALVRSANGVTFAQAGIYQDHEIPISEASAPRVCVYQATVYDNVGSVWGVSNEASAEWVSTDDWLKAPGRPTRDMRVTVQGLPTEGYTTPVGVFPVMGRPAPITRSDVRSAAQGSVLLYTKSDTERDQLHLLLSTGDVLLLQTPPSRGVGNLYVTIQNTKADRIAGLATEQWRLWTLDFVEVDEPVGAAPGAGPDWADVVAAYTDWQELSSAEVDWLDLIEGLNVDIVEAPPETIQWRGA